MSSRTYRVIRPALAAVLTALAALALATPALAADPRIPLTADPVLLPAGDYCQGFDVLIKPVDFNQYIIRSTTAPDGTVTLQIAGRARAKVTNQKTGESVSFKHQRTGHVCLQSG